MLATVAVKACEMMYTPAMSMHECCCCRCLWHDANYILCWQLCIFWHFTCCCGDRCLVLLMSLLPPLSCRLPLTGNNAVTVRVVVRLECGAAVHISSRMLALIAAVLLLLLWLFVRRSGDAVNATVADSYGDVDAYTCWQLWMWQFSLFYLILAAQHTHTDTHTHEYTHTDKVLQKFCCFCLARAFSSALAHFSCYTTYIYIHSFLFFCLLLLLSLLPHCLNF